MAQVYLCITMKEMTKALSQAIFEQIQSLYRRALEHGLGMRQPQKEMMAAIAKGLTQDSQRFSLVQAGTGVGKTIAYLLAALPVAQAKEATLIISTATITLQNQILDKDIVWLQSLLDAPLQVMLAKGRRHYLCPKQLEIKMADSASQDLFQEEPHAALYAKLHNAWEQDTWDGEDSSWPESLDGKLWSSITTDKTRCTGQSCSFFKNCPYFKARHAQQKADIVIANHDLVLSDLRLGGGVLLPPPEQCIYIFDEAHHLSEKTRNHGLHQINNHAATELLNQCLKLLTSVVLDDKRSIELIRGLIPEIVTQLKWANTTFSDLPFKEDVFRLKLQDIAPFQDLAEKLSGEWRELKKHLNKVIEALKKKYAEAEHLDADDEQILERFAQLVDNAESHQNVWLAFADGKNINKARWIKASDTDHGRAFELFSTPLTAASWLQTHLWKRCFGAVLTSATLKIDGAFHKTKQQLGLGNVHEVDVESPFLYQKQAKLYIPPMPCLPQDQTKHYDWLAQHLPTLTQPHQASLVLFSSYTQLGEVCDRLPASFLKQVWIQGDYSKAKLIENHKKQVEKGKVSILFGLASLAEGLDLPGKLCTHVIVTKLPFMPPNNPVTETMSEWYQSQNMDPFKDWMVPEAIIKLMQATGRLIRTEKDHGIITICDRRIIEKPYGKRFLKALPDYELVY